MNSLAAYPSVLRILPVLAAVSALAGCALPQPPEAQPAEASITPDDTPAAQEIQPVIGDWVYGEHLDARLITYVHESSVTRVPAKGERGAHNVTTVWHNGTIELLFHNGTKVLEVGLWPIVPPQGELYVWNYSVSHDDRPISASMGPAVGVVPAQDDRVALRWQVSEILNGVEHHTAGRFTWRLLPS